MSLYINQYDALGNQTNTWNWSLGSVAPVEVPTPPVGTFTVYASGNELSFIQEKFPGLRNMANASALLFIGEDALFIVNSIWFNVSAEDGEAWLDSQGE